MRNSQQEDLNVAVSLLLSLQEQLPENISNENAILLNVSHNDFIEMSQVFLMWSTLEKIILIHEESLIFRPLYYIRASVTDSMSSRVFLHLLDQTKTSLQKGKLLFKLQHIMPSRIH